MPPRFNPVRWLKIVGLGCVLAVAYIYWNLSLIPPASINANRPIIQAAGPLQSSAPDVKKQLTEVIQSQLVAFRKNDFHLAYRYAGSKLKAAMPLPVFEQMVRQGYPIMMQTGLVRFGEMVDNGTEALVNISLVGASGEVIRYQYFLVHERAGWRIYGVQRVPFDGTLV